VETTSSQRQALIAVELARINLLARANDDADRIAATAEIFADELAAYSLETISAAMREHARRSSWMPKLSEIISLCGQTSRSLEYQRQVRAAKLPAPEKLTDDQVALNLAKIQTLRDSLAHRRAMYRRRAAR